MMTTTTTRAALPVATLAAALLSPAAHGQQFVDGLAQPVFAGQAVISHNVWVEVANLDSDRDGVNDRIRIQVRRPQATEQGVKLPVVMIASPYSGGQLPFPQHDITPPLFVPPKGGPPPIVLPELPPIGHVAPYLGNEAPYPNISTSGYQTYFLPRGFIFVYAQSLGTGLSTGCPTIGGYEESLAMKAVVDWLNGNASGYDQSGSSVQAYWTTGATTMIGTSYDGTLPLAAASTGVEGLKAIVPIAGVSSYYDHRRSYGTVINSNPTIGTDADTLFDNILTRKYPQACSFMREQIAIAKDRTTGDYNAWWDERNYVNYVKHFKAAVFISHGLNDLNTKPRMYARLYEALKANGVPAKIWLNQGGHGDGANSGSRQAAWRDALNRFWTKYLFGIENGAMDGPKAAIQRENSQWLEYEDWPVPGAQTTTLYLGASGDNTAGQLSAEHISNWDRPGGGYETVVDDSSIDATALVAVAQSPSRLVYKTEPLAAPLHISGIPTVLLCLSFDQPAAVVSAMVVDYRADGTAHIVTRGWADPQNHKSISKTTPIRPGATVYNISFELQPDDYQFQPGSRIGFVVLSSDRLFTLRPPPGTQLTLTPSHSRLRLPVVGGSAAFHAATQ